MAQIQSIDVLCKPSVYLLFDQGVLVYVGQSKTPSSRVLQHRKDKIFDSFKILRCRPSRRMYWEDRLMQKFRPKYNKQMSNGARKWAAKPRKTLASQAPYDPLVWRTNSQGFSVSTNASSSVLFLSPGSGGSLTLGRGDGVMNGVGFHYVE
jgi:predicted GIY-YIG superfamily endonuclease